MSDRRPTAFVSIFLAAGLLTATTLPGIAGAAPADNVGKGGDVRRGTGGAAAGTTPPAAQARQGGAPAKRPDETDSARALTLDEALAAARKANRSLIAERTRLEQAQATVDRAWTVLFPTIAAQGKYQRNNTSFAFNTGVSTLTIQPVNQLDAVFSATMPLLVPAAYPALSAVKMNERATQEQVRAAEDEILYGVAQAFYAAATADEVLVARRSNIEVARATAENAKVRFSAGAVTKVDVDRAQLSLLRAEQAERDTKLAREQAYRALGTLLELEGPFKVSVKTPNTDGSGALGANNEAVSGDLSSALKLRPEFRALEAAAQAQDAQRRSEGWRWAPALSGFANARFFNYQNFKGEQHAWAVGAQLDWLLYDQGVRDANRRLAAAQAAETAARAEVLRQSIRDDLVDGRRRLETKAQARETFARAVELARETLELVRIQYEAGQITQIDLLAAQDALVGAEEALAQAHFDVAVADLSLRRAAGTFPPR